ncbi:MAG: hypothetical protein CVU20_06495 [Betaproteobacteria bacterium HGW-Betaproteobacteria-14]|nr:MAG: hypothetical protein CVU20_06495 [Betaproteobacteria bacterium HGW-Betaproteobacteria-14]
MFIGHFGIGFGAKAAAPRVSLGTLFLAAESPCCAGPRTGDARSLAARTPGFLGRFTPLQQNGGMARISKKSLIYCRVAGSMPVRSNSSYRMMRYATAIFGSGYSNEPSGSRPSFF